jgi:hypothetical protein
VLKKPSYVIGAGLVAISIVSGTSSGNAALAQGSAGNPLVFQAAAPDAASLQSTLDQFRLALGGENNLAVAGPLAEGRREINWDGGGSTVTSLVPTPFEGFLISRGALFTTPGSGFVQATVEGLATTFENPTYATIFKAFSPFRLFSPIGSRVTEVTFFIPGGLNITATTKGFGAVFSDVDEPNGSVEGAKKTNGSSSALISYFDAEGRVLYSSFVPASPGDGGQSFFGIVFEDARIASVRITAGDVRPGAGDAPGRDIVMMDDFIFGEPQGLQ